MQNQPVKFLRLQQVLERVPVGRSTIWAWVKQGAFPAPHKLGPGTSAWAEADINAWLASKAEGGR